MLRPNRIAFAQVFDRLRPAPPDFKMIALQRPRPVGETEEERGRRDIRAALERAEADGWLDRFTVTNVLPLVDSANVAIALQAITNPLVDFDHIVDISDGMIKAMRRCCRVICGEDASEVKGSGFLIGPQLVLTNWHVVRGQIEAEAAAAAANGPRPPVKLRVEFDAMRNRDGSLTTAVVEPVADAWRVDHSPGPGADRPADPAGTPQRVPAQLNDFKQQIDYAIIELANPVGYERGWYDLRADMAAPSPNTQGQLVQFPGNYAMRVTAGPYLEQPTYPGRVSHSMNTIGGSSGGLCATTTYEPLALHQGALTITNVHDRIEGRVLPTGTTNIAIPLGLIAARAGEIIQLRAREAPILIHQTLTAEPVVGRKTLQRAIHETIYGKARIIVVRNSYDPTNGKLKSGVGKSFSIKILEAMASPAEHVIRSLSAALLPRDDPYAAARVVLAPFHDPAAATATLEAFRAAMEAVSPGDTTPEADVRALGDLLLAALRAAAAERTVWLVVDDLDRHPVESSSQTASLLNHLYAAIATEPRVRIVLIGPTAPLVGLDDAYVRNEGPLGELNDTEIEQWIVLARGRERPYPPEAVAMVRNMAMAAIPHHRSHESLSQPGRVANYLKTVMWPFIR